MKNAVFLLIVLFFYSSCTEPTKVPEGILTPGKMDAVILDLIRADELVARQGYSDSTFKTLSGRTSLYRDVLSKHKLTKSQFQKSFSFYQNRPDLLKIVLDSMHSEVRKIEEMRSDSLAVKVIKKK